MDVDSIIALIIGAIISPVILDTIRFLLSRRRGIAELNKIRAEADEIDTRTFSSMRLQIQGLVEDNIKLHENINRLTKNIDELREDNRKFRNAYARAIRHVEELNPNIEMPDYLLDTQPVVSVVQVKK